MASFFKNFKKYFKKMLKLRNAVIYSDVFDENIFAV